MLSREYIMPVTRFMMRSIVIVLVGSLAASTLLTGCSSVKTPSSGDVSARYTYARELLAEEKHDRAIIELESLMFETRATNIEDDVLFELAEAYYNSKQYLLAVDIYKRLLEQTPGSPFAAEAQFKLAESYKKLSPVFARDQEYTRKAVREYQLYMELYPVRNAEQLESDVELYTELLKLNPDNEEYKVNLASAKAEYGRLDKFNTSRSSILELREKIANSEYNIAERYRKLKKYRGAIVYYENVLRFFPDTIYFEKAWIGRIELLLKREKWFEAKAAVDAYENQFPENIDKVEKYRKKVMKHFDNS